MQLFFHKGENGMKKCLGFLLLVVLGSVLLGGCGKKEDAESKKVNIRVAFWGGVEEKKIITETITDWEAKQSKIKIELEHIPVTSYLDKVLTEIAGRRAADVIFCDVNAFVPFFYKNVLLDLTPLIEKDKEFKIKINDFFPEVLARFTKKGKIFCIPRDTAPFAVIYYNKDLFDQLKIPYPTDDWDWDTFLKIAQKMTIDEKGKNPTDKGFNDKKVKRYGFWCWTWQNFVYSNGGKIVDDINNPTTCLLNQPQAIEGYQFYVDLMNKYNVAPSGDALANMGIGIDQMFAMGKLAMYQSGIWDTPHLREMLKFNWDVVMFPKGPGGRRGFATGGSGYAIVSATKHPQEAWEVIKCLAGDEGQEKLADTGLAQPANRKIAKGVHFAQSSSFPLNKGMLNEAVKYVVYDPFHIRWREAQDKYITPKLDLINSGKISVEEGFERIVPKVNALLREE